MRKIQWSIALALIGCLCLLAPTSALAEDEAYPEARYTVIHFDQVEPSSAPAYEENSAAWAAAFKEAGLGEEYAWRMYQGPNFGYAFLSDLPNFAALDKSEEQQKEVAEALGAEKMAELVAGVAASSHYSEVTKDVPELTYVPEGGVGDYGIVHLTTHHVKPGMNEQFKALAMKVIDAHKKVGSKMPVFGSEIQFGRGSFQFATLAKDTASFYAAPQTGAVLAEAYGPEVAQDLFNQWRDCITAYETSDWQFRPDLSYMPGAMEEEEMKGSAE